MQNTGAGKRSRIFEFDFLRAVAMVFVVAVHALGVVDTSHPAGLFFVYLTQAVLLTCNGLFFMLSGRFALTPTRKSYGAYYNDKIATIGIPVLFFFGLRTLYERFYHSVSNYPIVQAYARNTLNDFIVTEYWFIFVLVSLLLIAPLLAKGFQHLSRREHMLLLGLMVLHNGIRTVTTAMAVAYGYIFTFSDWFIYFYLGFALPVILQSRRQENMVMAAGGVCLALTVALSYLNVTAFIHDLSPLYTFVIAGMYLALYRIGGHIRSERARRAVSFIARHSFTVYLLHIMVLQPLTDVFQPYIIQSGLLSIPAYLLLAAVILVISLALAALLDATLLRAARAVYLALSHTVSRALKRD